MVPTRSKIYSKGERRNSEECRASSRVNVTNSTSGPGKKLIEDFEFSFQVTVCLTVSCEVS